MTAIFDALPGIEVPVGEIAASLARMWDDRADAGQPAPAANEVRATQVNFVLRFGLATTPDDALRQFRTAVAPADALAFPWPNPAAVRDLAFARTLPVRQSVGQFLSRYEPARLIDGLQTVTVAHAPALAAEGQVLRQWLQDRLTACGPVAAVTFSAGLIGAERGGSLELRFAYTGSSRFSWCGDDATGAAQFDADFGTGRTELPAGTSLLTPELALGEAMFC